MKQIKISKIFFSIGSRNEPVTFHIKYSDNWYNTSPKKSSKLVSTENACTDNFQFNEHCSSLRKGKADYQELFYLYNPPYCAIKTYKKQ